MMNNSYFQSLQQASLLNSVAVTGLATSGDSDACLRVFNETISLLEYVSRCPFLQKTRSAVPSVWKSFSLPEMQDDTFFVCPQALMFLVSEKPVVSEVDISFYSAIVIYNMALTYHQRGVQGTKQDMLKNALQLYEHCLRVLDTISSPDGDDIHRLKAITMNNQAQIYYLTHHHAQCQGLLLEIRKLCPSLLDLVCTSNTSGPFHGLDTIKEISVNAFLVTGSPSVAPSA